MYKTIITLKSDTPQEKLGSLHEICEEHFNNRAGKVINKSIDERQFIFEGDESLYGCLQLGVLYLYRKKDFLNFVSSWEWIDEEPDENCDILHELSIPVY